MKIAFLIALFCIPEICLAQEDISLYKRALQQIENSSEFKQLEIDRYGLSANSISFKNQAYAFWLHDSSLKFGNYDFENYFGEIYNTIKIPSFAALPSKRRSKFMFFVTETNHNLFIIELLSFKRKHKEKYPKFYQGISFSFLFKKEGTNGVKLLETIQIQNN